MGHPEWKEDPRFSNTAAVVDPANFAALGALLGEAFRQLSTEEVLDRLIEHDVPSGPILDADQVLEDAQILHNGSLVRWQHPDAGTVQQPRPAARFSETAAQVAESGAHLGQHNDEILGELGRSSAEISTLREAGVIN